MKKLGRNLTDIRKSKGLSQEALALKANVSIRTIQRIENGENKPSGHTLSSICDALGINIEEFSEYGKSDNKSYFIWLHLSAIIGIFITFILWITNKDKISELDKQGKNLLIFRLIYVFILFSALVISTIINMNYITNVNLPDSSAYFAERFSKSLIIAIVIDLIVSVAYPIYVAISIKKSERLKNYYPRFFK